MISLKPAIGSNGVVYPYSAQLLPISNEFKLIKAPVSLQSIFMNSDGRDGRSPGMDAENPIFANYRCLFLMILPLSSLVELPKVADLSHPFGLVNYLCRILLI